MAAAGDGPSLTFRLSSELNCHGKRIKQSEIFGPPKLVHERSTLIALGANELVRFPFRGSGLEPIAFKDTSDPKNPRLINVLPSGQISKLFVSNCRRHCIIATSTYENYYLHYKGRQALPLPKLSKIGPISTIAWFDIPFAGATDASPCHMLITTTRNQLFIVMNLHNPSNMAVKPGFLDVSPIKSLKFVAQVVSGEEMLQLTQGGGGMGGGMGGVNRSGRSLENTPAGMTPGGSNDQGGDLQMGAAAAAASSGVSVVFYTLYAATDRKLVLVRNNSPKIQGFFGGVPLNNQFSRNFDMFFSTFLDSPSITEKEVPYASPNVSELHHITPLYSVEDEKPTRASSPGTEEEDEAIPLDYTQESMVWITSSGMILMPLPKSQSLMGGSGSGQNFKIIPYPSSMNTDSSEVNPLNTGPKHEVVLGFIALDYHFLILFGNRKLVLVSRVNYESCAEQTLPPNQYGEVLSLMSSRSSGDSQAHEVVQQGNAQQPHQLFLICESFVYEVIVENESLRVWKTLLGVQDFTGALRLASSHDKLKVFQAQGERFFESGEYRKSAIYLAQLPQSIKSFESVCLLFLEELRKIGSEGGSARNKARARTFVNFDQSQNSSFELDGPSGSLEPEEVRLSRKKRREQVSVALIEYLKLKIISLRKEEKEGQTGGGESNPGSVKIQLTTITVWAVQQCLQLALVKNPSNFLKPGYGIRPLEEQGAGGDGLDLGGKPQPHGRFQHRSLMDEEGAQGGRNDSAVLQTPRGPSGGPNVPGSAALVQQTPQLGGYDQKAQQQSKQTEALVQKLLLFFLNQASTLDCASTCYQLLLSFSRLDEFLYFAKLNRDWSVVIRHFCSNAQYRECMESLMSMSSEIEHLEVSESATANQNTNESRPSASMLSDQRNALIEEYSPILYQEQPRAFISLLLKPQFSTLRPLPYPLQNAISLHARSKELNSAHRSEAIRYLEFVVRNKLQGNSESQVGTKREALKLLVLLYASASRAQQDAGITPGQNDDPEGSLIALIEQNEDSPAMDFYFALRVCQEFNAHRPSVLIYGTTKNHKEAVQVGYFVRTTIVRLKR